MNGPRFSFDELVVDTSVVVKFFVGEPDSDKAQALLQSFRVGAVDLVAVDFLFAEFVNTLWLKTHRSQMAVGEAEERIVELRSLASRMEIVPVTTILLETFRLASRHAQAAYDAAFLALAEIRNIPLVTADRRFYQRAKLHSQHAILLRDLEL